MVIIKTRLTKLLKILKFQYTVDYALNTLDEMTGTIKDFLRYIDTLLHLYILQCHKWNLLSFLYMYKKDKRILLSHPILI